MKATAILTNYLRPQNVPRIVASVRQSASIDTLFLIDNSSSQSASGVLAPTKSETYLPQRLNRGAGYRFKLSKSLESELFVCLDDDIFLTSCQLDSLVDRAKEAPKQMHGVWGQRIEHKSSGPWLIGGVFGQNEQLPILNRVYCYSKEYIECVFQFTIDNTLPDWENLGPFDDILMSLGGKLTPVCHDLGPLEECETSNCPKVAVWKTENFQKRRSRFISEIQHAVSWLETR